MPARRACAGRGSASCSQGCAAAPAPHQQGMCKSSTAYVACAMAESMHSHASVCVTCMRSTRAHAELSPLCAGTPCRMSGCMSLNALQSCCVSTHPNRPAQTSSCLWVPCGEGRCQCRAAERERGAADAERAGCWEERWEGSRSREEGTTIGCSKQCQQTSGGARCGSALTSVERTATLHER